MIQGKAHLFGANVDTDAIIPTPYANLTSPTELGTHCLEGIAPEFVKKVQPGDIIVATTNFGCGSSRELAPLSIKGAGVSCVIAKTFARIFFRNAINIALPLLECPEAANRINDLDQIKIDLSSGNIHNMTQNEIYIAAPYPDFIQGIIDAGGLISYTRAKKA